MERELQKSYGYKVDITPYNKLIKSNKMKINATEQTSTFPVPLNKLKGRLQDNIGLTWLTEHGGFEITQQTIPWVIEHARTSMFNSERCYIYNKAFSSAFNMKETTTNPISIEDTIYDKIRIWAKAKGIYDKGDSKTQYLKLMEEAGELSRAILKRDRPEIIDAIGDMVVVLTNLAKLENLDIEDCIVASYNVIKSRKGKMVNGTFVKESTPTLSRTVEEMYGTGGVINTSTTLTKEEILNLKRNTGQLTNPKVPNYSNQPFETL
jgi:NTP pyrophosphatase (non-canonical NTP hydrolase)